MRGGSIRAYEENVRSPGQEAPEGDFRTDSSHVRGPGRGGISKRTASHGHDLQVGDEMFGYVKELVGEEGTMMLPR